MGGRGSRCTGFVLLLFLRFARLWLLVGNSLNVIFLRGDNFGNNQHYS